MRPLAKVAVALLVAAGSGALAAIADSPPAKPPAVESAFFDSAFYGLAVENGDIAVTGGSSAYGCGEQLFNPASLRPLRSVSRCETAAHPTGPLVVDVNGMGDELHVAVTNPRTHKTSVGPLLATVSNWAWNHSRATTGDGSLWIFALDSKTLLQVSLTTGRLEHRWSVNAGADPWMAVDDDGFWMTSGVWGGGPFCAKACALWHVAPGSHRLVVTRDLGNGTQWFSASGHDIYLDELTTVAKGYQQSMWQLDGSAPRVAYKTAATLLPAPDFGGTGYVIEGTPALGFFTLSQLGAAHTPTEIGACNSSTPMRIVRIDPTTGKESYIATLPKSDVGSDPECYIYESSQALIYEGALYLLSDVSPPGDQFGSLVRVPV